MSRIHRDNQHHPMRTKTSYSLTIRSRVLAAICILFACVIIVRLYFIQIVHGAAYATQGEGQYVEQDSDQDLRGSIYFTRKDGTIVAAATMQSGWRIAINPALVTDPEHTWQSLNAITPIDHTVFITDANKKNDPYEEVAFRLTDATADQVRALSLPGVLLVRDQWRMYPGDSLASQTIGFVGYEGDTKMGEYGLEKEFQHTLALDSNGLYVNPFAEIFSNISDAVSIDPTARNGSVITTIDPSVQTQLETALQQVMTEYSPDFDGGVIMDPHTGAIYAIAGEPSFDPNSYNTVADPIDYQNRLVSGRYELGSIMKPLTMAAGIDSGAITQNTTYNDTGCITRSSARVCNYDLKARGVIPMQTILDQSLNVGASFVADTMGHATQTRYMHAYGFASTTGIDLPNEVAGDLSPLGNGTGPDVNYDTASFGQGIAISPIEMTRALAALANGGVLPNPHVVRAIQYESGLTRNIDAGTGPRVLSTTTADTVTTMLIHVVDTSLLNGKAKQEHYSIAAKTGTAEIPAKGGGYLPMQTGSFLHSFFGYFPARNPRFIIFLFAWKPHGQEYASATLAQPFLTLTQYLINYYNIPPDR